MEKKIRILILEDVASDAELLEHELQKAKVAFCSRRVETREGFLGELKEFEPDLVISDYMLPQFNGMDALLLVKEIAPSTPFIIVTGSMNEEIAVECMKAGAVDYIIKKHLIRIGPAVRAALENKHVREKKQKAEEALLNSAWEWQTTFNSIGDSILLTDLKGKIRRCNKAPTELLGKMSSDIIGEKCCKLVHGTLEPIQECPFVRMLATRQRESHVFKMGECWINESVDPILDKAGNLTGAVHILLDITGRREAEEELSKERNLLRTLIDNHPDAIYVKDAESRFLICNSSVGNVMGVSKLEDIIGKTDFDYYPEELASKYYADEQEIIHTGRPIISKEEIVRDANGNNKWFLTTKVPLHDTYGDITGIVGIGRNITERKSLEQQLIQSQKMEVVGRLAGGIAHDFNNMLTAIIGYSDFLLMSQKYDDSLCSLIKEIKKAGEKAASLTHQLLAFSRRQVLQTEVLNINELVSDMEKMIQHLIGENIELVIILEPELGKVKIDPSQFEQVIMNLAVNARDAMPQGGRLIIETANVFLDKEDVSNNDSAQPGPYIQLTVSDSGTGMDRETLSHIFEPFFTTKEKGKGTGLGLSTVYGIVKQSGGNICVYSEPGNGTTFKIYLPQVQGKAKSVKLSKLTTKSLRGTETILLVEDENIVRYMVSYILNNFGYTVLEAKEGNEALRITTEHGERPIDLIVTDVIMPGMSGRELADKLTAQHSGVKVLYISGYTDDAIGNHEILDESTPFLQKPFTPSVLINKVREVLESK